MDDCFARRRAQALSIWQAGVDAVRPERLMPRAIADASLGLARAVGQARRVLVLGAGKAGAAMAQALIKALPDCHDKLHGVINVPNETVRPLEADIELHGARPAASNHPTAEGVAGAERMLDLARSAASDDVGLVLLSGGGSALLPAPCRGITLEQKQQVTLLLHACGASINEMNTVRKHLSAIKGGRLAQAFQGRALYSLILSDVMGDPLDVIASGPTVADPTTFAEALQVLRKFNLLGGDSAAGPGQVPAEVTRYLEAGASGHHEETPKQTPANVHNVIIGNNQLAVEAAARRAMELGFQVRSLGSNIGGDTGRAALDHAEIIAKLLTDAARSTQPICLISGGETTVSLGDRHGKGGRNQEFALSLLLHLGPLVLSRVTAIAAGTDGEDGPTDAAGAIADLPVWERGQNATPNANEALAGHNAYAFFDQADGLVKTGLTQTNVMDLRVVLVYGEGCG
jgi:glycerate 2-kinase